MIVCPFCEAELKSGDMLETGWDCACGEFVPKELARDTEARKCGGQKCD